MSPRARGRSIRTSRVEGQPYELRAGGQLENVRRDLRASACRAEDGQGSDGAAHGTVIDARWEAWLLPCYVSILYTCIFQFINRVNDVLDMKHEGVPKGLNILDPDFVLNTKTRVTSL